MATYEYTSQMSLSSSRSVAMVLALVTAVVLSPLYMYSNNDRSYRSRNYDSKWSSGFVLPMLLAGLIVAIKNTTTAIKNTTTASTSKVVHMHTDPEFESFRKRRSSWGVAGVLMMLVFLLSWQNSVQDFFWR